MKTLLTGFFLAILMAMLAVTIYASFDRDVLTAAVEIWQDPWGKATLFDAYFGFLTVFVWIAYRERSHRMRALWLVLLLVFGNIAIAIYFLLALRGFSAADSWHQLFARKEL